MNRIATLLLSMCLPLFLNAQILINEVASSNQNLIEDESGDFPDWIELYNYSENKICLDGWTISDEEFLAKKWTFPDTCIEPNGFLLIFASGKDVTTDELHTNFKLKKTGEQLILLSPNEEIVDELQIPPLETDISYGFLSEGGTDRGYFQEPTPNSTNVGAVQIYKLAAPTFSIEEPFQNTPFDLAIFCPSAACKIYYTLDGSAPSENASEYTSPIPINKNVVVRAIAFKEGMLASQAIAKTFFINVTHTFPIISISSNPDNFFDYENGIFQTGPDAEEIWPFWGANYWKDIQIPVSFEYFDVNQQLQANYHLGLQTHGGRQARTQPLKSMRLLSGQDFDTKKMYFPFFKEKDNPSYNRLVLRNSSGDFNNAHFRGGFLSRYLIQENLDIELLAYQPSIVYINGAYWGILNIREKADEFYLVSNFGINPNKVDVLEENDIVIKGDFSRFDQHYDFVRQHNMQLEANFQQAAQYFDVRNMADYFIAQTAIVNTDWPRGNLKFWRERKADAKWRYIMFDLDASMHRHGWSSHECDLIHKTFVEFEGENKHINLIKALLENQAYREYFLNRYADLLNTTFRPEILSAKIGEMAEEIYPEIEAHFSRWAGCPNCGSFELWDTLFIPNVVNFAEKRAATARQHLMNHFELPNEVKLDLNIYPENAGSIQINTIIPDQLPWNGWYFNGVPVSLIIKPNPGFEFSHWQSLHTIVNPNFNENIKYNFKENDEITAYFISDYEGMNITATPNPTNSLNQIAFTLNRIENIQIKIADLSGRILEIFPPKRLNGGRHYQEIDFSHYNPGMYWISIETSQNKEVFKIIKM